MDLESQSKDPFIKRNSFGFVYTLELEKAEKTEDMKIRGTNYLRGH